MNDNNFKNYNPANRGKAFNCEYGRRDLTTNCTPVTDEQEQQAAQRLQDLIIKTQNDLTEDCLWASANT